MSIEVAIVGAYGSAGTAAADRLVDHPDVSLHLIDDGDPGGGLCILRGCMPSKAVLSAGAHRYQARSDDRLGDPPSVDLDAVVATKDRHVERFAEHRRSAVHEWAERDDVTLSRATAAFDEDGRLAVGEQTVDPDYVILATGSRPFVPDLPGIEAVDPWTSADVLDATAFPDTGVVLGFGYVGLELVPYLVEVGGMDLTVIEHDDRPLDEADPAFGDEILSVYREDFDVEILTNAAEQRVDALTGETSGGDASGVRLAVADEDGDERTIEADALFAFTGREPALADLGLERVGIEPGPAWVADTMQAVDDERVFVVGDANDREPILHVAKEEGQRAAENLLAHHAGDSLDPYENVHHHVVFSGLSVYPFARVGHSAASARAAGLDVVVTTRRASDDGVFETKDVPEGLARLVVDAGDGTVLGYQGLHYHADVMAKTMQVIVERELDVRAVPDRAYHPTTPEILDGLVRDAAAALDDSAPE